MEPVSIMAWLQALVWYTRSTTQGQPARTWSTSPSEQVSLAHRLRRLSAPTGHRERQLSSGWMRMGLSRASWGSRTASSTW